MSLNKEMYLLEFFERNPSHVIWQLQNQQFQWLFVQELKCKKEKDVVAKFEYPLIFDWCPCEDGLEEFSDIH